MFMDNLAQIVGGLGLFFAGIWFLNQNVKKLAGRHFRQTVTRATKNPLASLGFGSFFGTLSQSISVLIFVLIGLLSAGAISIRSAMPILVGANLGPSALVFLTTIDFMGVMLLVMGIAGLVSGSQRFIRYKYHTCVLFSIGLLFFGIDMLQTGVIALLDNPWAGLLLRQAMESYILCFMVGCVVSFLVQSSVAACILIIALAGAGVFGVEQTMMVIYGSKLGTGLLSLLLCWKLKGKARQLIMFQVIYLNLIATALFIAAFYAETLAGIPLVKAVVLAISSNFEQQLAWVYLLINLPGLFFLCFSKSIETTLACWFPATEFDDDSKPKFLHDQAANDPAKALDLIKLEQQQLFRFLPRYFESLRLIRSLPASSEFQIKTLHQSFQSVGGLITELLEDLQKTRSGASIHSRLNIETNNAQVLFAIEATIFEIAETIETIGLESELNELTDNIIEALDTLLLTLNDVLIEDNEFDRKLLSTMTRDRNFLLQKIRTSYHQSNRKLRVVDQKYLMKMTNLFERFIWLIGDLRIHEDTRVRMMPNPNFQMS